MVSYTDIFLFISESNSRSDFDNRVTSVSHTIICEFNRRITLNEVQFDYQVAQIIDELIEETAGFIDNVNSINIIDDQPMLPEDLVLKIISAFNKDVSRLWTYQKYTIQN